MYTYNVLIIISIVNYRFIAIYIYAFLFAMKLWAKYFVTGVIRGKTNLIFDK